MKVLVGPTYNMASSSSSSPVCVGDQSSTIGGVTASVAQDNNKAVSSSCLFLNGVKVNNVVGDPNTFGSDDSSDSSSIGSPVDSGDEYEDEDQKDVVSSSETGVGLQRNKFSMSSLEDSLTSKRGLSNHYSGKSKSFGNLTEVMSMTTAIKDLEKEENPFNKRRRVLIANKWSRKFFYSRHNPKSMPLLPILPDNEEEEEEEEKPAETNNHDDEEEEDQEQERQHLHGNKLKVKVGFKSQSCFCLADLAEEEEEEEEEN